jgi:cytoskeletal protein CcmA (bactofilin family)
MAASKESSGSDSAPSGNTVIGPSILISGKLTGDEDLTVRGRVEGELTLTKTLIVEPSGVVKANVEVRNAVVSGVVVGNINATESVELTREGRMVGDIRAPRVIIVDGASFRGRVDMGDLASRPAGERTARPIVRPTVRPGTQVTGTRPSIPTRASTPVVANKGKPSAPLSKPLPPPPPKAAPKVEVKGPTPVLVGAGAKKKVVLKKKG